MVDPSRDPTLAPPLGGRYEIAGLLAAGGAADVYEARDTVLARTVALKVLRASIGADPEVVEALRREATNAARLGHPGVVQVYDFGTDPAGVAYMAMERVKGRSLREALADRGRLPAAEAARIAADVCAALEHAHRARIVHGDVKPENILLGDDGRVRVADFGLSRALEAAHEPGDRLHGTPQYVAPEQVAGRPADGRADLYALGVVLFEMLTGRPPFDGTTPAEVAGARLSRDVPPPSEGAPDVPEGLDGVVARATARRPEDRYASAAEMARALAPWAAPGPAVGSGTTAIPIDRQDTVVLSRSRARRRRRRRRILIAALAAAALVAGALVPVALGARRVAIPDVAGQGSAGAQRAVEAAGLVAEVTLETHETVPTGTVIRTEPPIGGTVRRGTLVRLIVSLGPPQVEIPDVLGRDAADAEELLREAGLEVERLEEFSASHAKGTVIDQQPSATVFVRRGSTVTITVSKGVEMVAVPEVTGRKEADARKRLSDAGFAVAVERRFHDSREAGTVVSQSPAAGRKAERGSTVTIVVSKGPPPVDVPDLECMTRKQAQDALKAAGLEPKFSGEGNRVVDQSPAPGTQAPRGSKVEVFLGVGAFC